MLSKNLSRKKLLKIFAMIVMSDGTMFCNDYGNPAKIRLTTMSKSQHEYFRDLSYKLFNQMVNPKVVFRRTPYNKKKTRFYTSTINSRKSCDELLILSPTYKTTPGRNTSTHEYINSAQPTINFLFRESSSLKWEAIKTLFDFDGSISPSFRTKNKKDIKKGKTYSYHQVLFHCEIHFAETNPQLINEIFLLFESLDLKPMIVKNKRNWSGLDGLQLYRRKDVLKFLNNGGPMTSVKISSKSKNFAGFTKQSVCMGIKELLERKDMKYSYYFKNKKEAEIKCKELNKEIMEIIKKYSPVV